MTARDIELVEMAPPDMPAALYANQVAAYATGEPFGAVAEVAGYGRIHHMTRDEWPRYICCVRTVDDDLIRTNRPLVPRLVDHVMSAGFWLEVADRNRFTAADIAAAPAVFNPGIDRRYLRGGPQPRVPRRQVPPRDHPARGAAAHRHRDADRPRRGVAGRGRRRDDRRHLRARLHDH